jgi:hypothetical protein
MSDIIPPNLPEMASGVDEEALKALFEADVGTTEVHGSPVPESEKPLDLVLDEGIKTDSTEAVKLFGLPDEGSS